MNTIEIMFICLIGLFLLFTAVVCAPPNPLYMFFFEHKQWRLWRYMHKNVRRFTYKKSYYGVDYYCWGAYTAIIWEDGRASVHSDSECLLSNFDERNSRRFAAALKEAREIKDRKAWILNLR